MSYRFNILSASTSSSIFRNCSNHQLGSTSHVIALSVIVLHPAMRELMRKCCEGGGDPPIRSLSRESRCVASTHIEGRIDRGGRLVVTASVICSVPSLGDDHSMTDQLTDHCPCESAICGESSWESRQESWGVTSGSHTFKDLSRRAKSMHPDSYPDISGSCREPYRGTS
jgi:hypothetical protein